MKKITTLLLCLLTITLTSNAKNIFVDPTNGVDTRNGTTWESAVKTLGGAVNATYTSYVLGDNIYVKGGALTTLSTGFTASATQYYGSCDLGNTGAATTRTLNDNDGNGIIEPWEFKYPTVFSSTYGGTGTAVTLVSSTTLDGFTITQTTTSSRSADAAGSVCISPAGSTIQNCVFSGSNLFYPAMTSQNPGGCVIKTTGTLLNSLIEKNILTITIATTGSADLKIYPIVDAFVNGNAPVTITVSGCVFRNNKATLDYSGSSSTACSNLRGMVLNISDGGTSNTAGTKSTVTISDCLVYNNEIAFTGNGNGTGGTFATPPNACIATHISYSGSNTTNNWVNNTFANNKSTNLKGACMTLCANGKSPDFVINNVYNNVFWNNQNTISSTSTTTNVSIASGSAQNPGTVVTNNVMDVATSGTWGTNLTYTNNLINLSKINTTATYGPQFRIISSAVGYIADGSVELADWRLNSGSYLIGRGTTYSGISNDKAGNAFAATPSAGAYEAVPIITTTTLSNITDNSAASGGTIVWNGGTSINASGVCWSTSQNPTINDSKTADNATSGSFSSSLTGLSSGVTYYVRAYATNSNYTSYGMQQSFTTLSNKPEPTNQAINFAKGTVTSTAIPLTFTAAVAGSQAPDGYLVKMSTGSVTDPVDGTDPADVTTVTSGSANVKVTTSPVSSFSGLNAGTMYHYKMYSYTNSGAQINFNTALAPTLDIATLPVAVSAVTFTPTVTDFSTATLTANLSWTNPGSFDSGNHSTLVFVKQNSVITAGLPSNGPGTYTASTNMTTGNTGTPYQSDASAYCVYNGTGTSVSLSGMVTGATYYVLIVTVYNTANSDGTYSYSSGASASAVMYKREPSNYPTNLAVSNVTSTSVSLTWTPSVSGSQAPDGYYIVSKALSSVPYPVDGTDQSDVTAYTSSVAFMKVSPQSATGMSSFSNMTPGTTYYYRVFPYTNSGTQINFKTSGVPANLNYATFPNPVTSVLFNSLTTGAATISWTLPTGYSTTRHSTLVFVKATSAITQGSPVLNPTTYTANTVFGSGTAYEGDAAANCVYKGDGSSVSISGLTSNSTYQVLVYTVVDFVNTDLTYSFSAGATATGATILDAPTISSVVPGDQSLTVNFTAPGLNSGSDITNYKYSTDGGSTFTACSPAQTSSPIIITGLTNGTTYNIQIKAVNANGDGTATASTQGTPVGGNITVTSNINISTLPTTLSTDVTVDPGYELTVNSDASVKSITVSPGAKLTIGSATLTATNGVILQSSPSGTGTLVDNALTSPQAITGTVQQYVTAGRNWYVSIPLGTTASSVLNKGTSVVCYDEPSGAFIAPVNGTLEAGRGYISVATSSPSVTGSTGTMDFTGTLNTGDVSVGLTRHTGVSKEGFNLVGNPYPSYLDFSKVDTTAANILSTIWYRTQTAEYAYTFDTYNGMANLSTTNGATTVTKMIPPMQAFWVRVKAGQTSGTLTFTNAMRAHSDNSGNRLKAPAANQSTQQVLRLQVSNGTNTDETVIYTNPNASNGYDAFDSPKMSNNSASIPEIFTIVGTEQLVINGLNNIVSDREIPLGLTPGNSTLLSIKTTELSNFDPGTRVVLRDYLNPNNVVEQDLTDGAAYSFTPAGTAVTTNRFTLVFKSPSVTTGLSGNNTDLNIHVFRNGSGQIAVSCPTELIGKATMSVLNAVGQKLETRRLLSTVTVLTNNFEFGVYVVNVVANGKVTTQKIIIN